MQKPDIDLIKEEQRRYKKEWRDKNREHLREYHREYRKNNKNRIDESNRKYWLRKAQKRKEQESIETTTN